MSDSLRISEIIIGARVRKDMGDIKSLAESMKRHGLLHPVVVKKDRTLVAGHRRIEAARRIGWRDIPVTVIEVNDLLSAERAENTERKDFTTTEAVAIGKMIEEQHRVKIAVQEAARKALGPQTVAKNLGQEAAGRTRERVAQALGIGGKQYDQAKAVVAAAEKDPQHFGDLPSQMDETGNVSGAHRELQRRKGKTDKKKVPLSKTGKNVERIQEQKMRAEIWQQVRDSLINLTSLPDAEEVVTIVKAHARDKTFVDKRLVTALKWLKEFANGWSKVNGN